MIAAISHEEYAARQNRARELMQTADLQALLITDPTNLFYFTGASYFGEMSYPRPAALLVPQAGESVLLNHDFHLAVPWQGNVREYPKVGELPVHMLQDMSSEAGCADGRIGMELGREQRLGIPIWTPGKPDASDTAADCIRQNRLISAGMITRF